MKKNILFLLMSLGVCLSAQVNLTANLTVCMPFSGNALDGSGNGNNGVVSGAALTADRFGNINQAYVFNGSTDYIAIKSFSAIAPTNELTISMWAKVSIHTSNCLFEIVGDTPHDRCVGCAQYAYGNNSTMMLWDYGSIYTGGRTQVTGIPFDNNSWHHYVYIISQQANTKQMYIDGSIIDNSSYSLSCVNKDKPFYIGAALDTAGGDLHFHGSIDDVYMYNRALNASEVSALYSGLNVCSSVGVSTLKGIENILVYPTVSGGVYTLVNAKPGNALVEVCTMDGKRIRLYESKDLAFNGVIDISDAAGGIYILKVTGPSGSFVQKLIKN